jgi:hypothetical protein
MNIIRYLIGLIDPKRGRDVVTDVTTAAASSTARRNPNESGTVPVSSAGFRLQSMQPTIWRSKHAALRDRA